MHHLIRSGLDRLTAMRRARAYAGGKTSPKAGDLFLFETDPGPTVQGMVALGEVGQPIQIAKVGTFRHPQGAFSITPEMCEAMARNFASNARGVELAVDENHDPDHKAVGWFRDVQARDGGLWATVEWNDRGAQLLKDGTYRYFSPELAFNHVDNETGQEHGPTLLGGALTNRPHLKGMEPVALSEVGPATAPAEGEEAAAPEEDCHEAMLVLTRQSLIDALRSFEPIQAVAGVLSSLNAYLDADAAEDDAEAGEPDGASALPPIVTDPTLLNEAPNEEPAPPERSPEMTNPTATPAPAAPAAPDANAIALAEVARLQQEIALKEQQLNERAVALAEREKSARTAELTAKFEALCKPDSAGVVRVSPGQKDPALAMVIKLNEVSPELADAQLALLATNPGVKLGEVGTGVSQEGEGGSAAERIETKAKALAETKGVSLSEAREAVVLAEPALYDALIAEKRRR